MNVQQEDRSEDCGLIAIAFAAMVPFNQDPVQAVINQSVMHLELLESFHEHETIRDQCGYRRREEEKESSVSLDPRTALHMPHA